MGKTFVAVMPWIYKPYRDACVATMAPEFREHLLEVDNTQHNVGIMRAHNMGIAKMRSEGADWLIILSAAVRFGQPEGGKDFIKVLQDHPDFYVIHASSSNSPSVPNIKDSVHEQDPALKNKIFGWHATAFRSSVFDNIGLFDENFSVYGYDDLDLSIRLQYYYKGKPGWGVFPINIFDTSMSHGINLGGVKTPDAPKAAYFERKWLRPPGSWQIPACEHPFNDPTKPLSWWPKSGDPLANQEAWDSLERAGG